ncbi:MAG: hypothetical protein FWE67_08930 [Planctomycetaceae bacterium]|nr:hypothetical protein [Planctomycetaceae bacterium]
MILIPPCRKTDGMFGLQLHWKILEIFDKNWIEPLIPKNGVIGSDSSFAAQEIAEVIRDYAQQHPDMIHLYR